jgi:hypothetical protein
MLQPSPRMVPANPRRETAASGTGVHIGSIEVEIVPVAEAPAPSAAPQRVEPAPSAPASAAPLTRGLTSPIGLRQS